MRTAAAVAVPGDLHQAPPQAGTPPKQAPPRASSPREQTPHLEQAPPLLVGHVTCKACWDTTPPVDRILDTRC